MPIFVARQRNVIGNGLRYVDIDDAGPLTCDEG